VPFYDRNLSHSTNYLQSLHLCFATLFRLPKKCCSFTKIFKSFKIKEVKMNKIQFRVLQGISPFVFCAIIIAGLCFGHSVKGI